MTGVRFVFVAAVSAVVLGLSAFRRRRWHEQSLRNCDHGNRGCRHRRLSRARHQRSEQRLVRQLHAGVHGSRRARARSGLVGVASAQNITWHVALPADGTTRCRASGRLLVRRHGRGHEPAKIGEQGFLELQFYPDSFTKNCFRTGDFSVSTQPERLHGVLAGLDDRPARERDRRAGGVQRHAHGRHRKGPVRHARPRHRRRPHLGAGVEFDAYREQVRDETSGQTSSVLVLVSPKTAH